MKYQEKLVKKAEGFSLLEVIISLVVFSVFLLSVFHLFFFLAEQNGKSKTQTTAFFLAQECLELVRNKRDSNWKKREKWNKDLGAAVPESFPKEALLQKFSRKVFVENFTLEDATTPDKKANTHTEMKKITCEVFLREEKVFTLSEILTNWK